MNINYYSSCEYTEVQSQLTALLGLHDPNSTISATSIASLAANTDTDTAYRQFCKELDRVGVTEVVMRQKKQRILEILRSHGMVASNESDDSDTEDHDLELEAAYKQFCEDLYRMGITEAFMPPKDEILRILRTRGMVSSSQTGGNNNIGDKGQLLAEVVPLYSQPLTYEQIILARQFCLHLGRALW